MAPPSLYSLPITTKKFTSQKNFINIGRDHSKTPDMPKYEPVISKAKPKATCINPIAPKLSAQCTLKRTGI